MLQPEEYMRAIRYNFMTDEQKARVVEDLLEDNNALSRLIEDIESGRQLPARTGLDKEYFNQFAEQEFWREVLKRGVIENNNDNNNNMGDY